jgi:hypothetical protein
MDCFSSSELSEYQIETTEGYASPALVTSLPNVIALIGLILEKDRAKTRMSPRILFILQDIPNDNF